jgi:hypothetical protein
MGTYLNVDGDPNELVGKGAILRAMAESFAAQARALRGEISAIEGEAPWGADSYGEAFRNTYYTQPDGADQPLPTLVSTGLDKAGERLSKVGDNTVLAMTDYQGTDAGNAGQINQAAL